MTIKNCYRPNEFADLIGVSVTTLQRWDRAGRLTAGRTPAGRRYYTHEQYLEYMGQSKGHAGETVIYARVSTRKQKDCLANQTEFLKQSCNARGIVVDRCVQDYGSGLNYNRKAWNDLLDDVMAGRIARIVVTNKDRFVRFGFDWFEAFCKKFDTEIMVVNNEAMSPNEEFVQDILSIIHAFSCRLYGLRKYRSKIKEDDEIAKSLQDGDRSDDEPNLDTVSDDRDLPVRL